jgi:hypothetical protein
MPRYVYGHDYKPPSNVTRNLLVGIVAMIVVVAFVWKTYDPQTLRLISGVQPTAEKMQPAAVLQRIDAKPQSGSQDKRALHERPPNG